MRLPTCLEMARWKPVQSGMWAAVAVNQVSPECGRRETVSNSPAFLASRKNLRPYIHVEGESTVPSGITLFAANGGRWNLIEIPDELVELPLTDQMPALAKLMREYLTKYEGQCPFFGRVRGFRMVRREDSLRFSAAGEFIDRVDGVFRRAHSELEIANKAVESLFG